MLHSAFTLSCLCALVSGGYFSHLAKTRESEIRRLSAIYADSIYGRSKIKKNSLLEISTVHLLKLLWLSIPSEVESLVASIKLGAIIYVAFSVISFFLYLAII